ncbi:uncharacterized protein KY384_006386 [Bacidia gigantensis]|uniref:uncharacterized protein n=1 Tax=Bacidia gigantensis TaxID=2732470 RepID=UPI001D041000|nr:uncharacterized protein KY384_006386 [Bacidia gigantensis]KAG8528699.1 hypothetical protein KY384_006386 [Bacidia gigantensis]
MSKAYSKYYEDDDRYDRDEETCRKVLERAKAINIKIRSLAIANHKLNLILAKEDMQKSGLETLRRFAKWAVSEYPAPVEVMCLSGGQRLEERKGLTTSRTPQFRDPDYGKTLAGDPPS